MNHYQSAVNNFKERHIGTVGADDAAALLQVVGYDSMAAFIADVVPASVYDAGDLGVGEPMSEHEALSTLAQLAAMNTVYRSLIGQGYYGAITPTVILRNVCLLYTSDAADD